MRFGVLLFLLAVSAPAFSQTPVTSATFAESIDQQDLKRHLKVLASDSMEGRETATEGQRKAARYIQNYFESIGLRPGMQHGYEQTFPVFQDSLLRASVSVNGETLKMDSQFVVTGNSVTNGVFTASEIVFAGYGLSDTSRDDYADLDVSGKVVMVIPGAPKTKKRKSTRQGTPDYYTIQRAARKHGATALLIVDRNFPRAPLPAKGSMYVTDRRVDSLPNTFLISESVARSVMGADYVPIRKMVGKTPLPTKTYPANISLELDKKTIKMESTNVIAVLEGSDKASEALIITAHYDHLGRRDSVIFYGADDDASGTVAVMEIAQAFANAAAAGARPRRTVIFMAVSGEEKGLWGSAWYALHPTFEMQNISANLNIDMIGRIEKGRGPDSSNYVFVVGDDKLSSELRPLSERVNQQYSGLSLDYRFNNPRDPMRIYYRSDHYNFAKNGVPVMFYFNGLHADYHRPSDTEDKINYELLKKRARFIFHTAWEIVNRDQLMARDIPL